LIFRVTRKLASKIKTAPVEALPAHDDPLLDWTANLFRLSRWQCLILTNSASLYSVIFPGRGITNEQAFVGRGLKSLRDSLFLDGMLDVFETMIAPAADSVSFCKASDRSVLGSINELVFQATCDFLETGYPLVLVNRRINRIPMSRLKYCFGVEEFAALANKSR
jgi:hypothetical protein